MSISAKYLTCFVGGSELEGTHEYNVNERGDRIEATTGSDNGRGKKDVGVIDTMMRVMLYADAATFDPTGISAGTVLSVLQFWTDNNNSASSKPRSAVRSGTNSSGSATSRRGAIA